MSRIKDVPRDKRFVTLTENYENICKEISLAKGSKWEVERIDEDGDPWVSTGHGKTWIDKSVVRFSAK